MIAFSWRQFRTQAVIGGAGLVVLGIILLVTGPHLVSIYDTALAQCRASGGASSDCNNPVVSTYSKLQVLATALVLIVPVLIGMFWGAPLIARELETGTFRLAWTQSVSRMRWLLVKLGLVGLASAAVGGLLSLMVTWWYSPIDKVNQNRFGAAAFGRAWIRTGGIRVVRLRARCHHRAALPPHAPRHGRHARRLHRGAVRLSPTGSGRTS